MKFRRRHLLVSLLIVLPLAGCGRERPWNVLVVTLDTTRADFLGCYGRTSARTSHLDRLAAEGFLFERAISAAPVTLPSHSTIFTGTYPTVHGVRDNGLFHLPPASTTLAEILKARGYATAAAIGAYPLAKEFGLDQGFELYDDHVAINAEDPDGQRIEKPGQLFFDERSAVQVNDAILPWLRRQGDRPFFAWIHYWDAHHPHVPPEPFNQLYQHDLYQGEIAFVDQSLGAVLRALEEIGAAERTLIVVVGDHGEGRGEHYEDTHSQLLYDATLHVPLIFKVPALAGGRRLASRVGTVDILPTLLDLLGIAERPAEIQGKSLATLLEGAPDVELRRALYAETLSPRLSSGWGELRALYEGKLKYIHGPRPELFDLDEDPRENQNLKSARPEEAAKLKQDLEVFLARQQSPVAAQAIKGEDGEIRRKLAALGYLSSAGDKPENIREELLEGGIAPQDRVADNGLSSLAKQQISEGNFLEARDAAHKLVERDPGNAFYRGLLAMAWLGLGRPEEAADALGDASSMVAQNEKIFLQTARDLWQRDRNPRGRQLLERFLEGRPHAAGRYLLGEMLAEQNDLAGYERELRAALAIDPKFPPARLSLAILLAKAGDRAAAEAAFASLLSEFPWNARYHFNYAVALLEPADPARQAKAIEHFERAIEIHPSYWRAHLQLLALRLGRGEKAEATALYERLENVCPDAAMLARARELMREGGA